MGFHINKNEPPLVNDKEGSFVWTIYCHTHIESGRHYIGITKKTWRQRWDQHVSQAKHAETSTNHWYNAIRKYGRDAFSHKILEICSSLEEANFAEDAWIESFSTRDPKFGFNLMIGGTCRAHQVSIDYVTPEFREKCKKNVRHLHTPEARAKQKASLTQETRSNATKAVMARPEVQRARKALHETAEHRGKISQATSDALSSSEARERLARASRESATDEVRRARGQSIRAAYQNPEVKARHRAAVKQAQNRPEVLAQHASRTISEETRQKIRDSSTGRKHSPEAIECMRTSFLERRDRLLVESGTISWSEYVSKKISARFSG